MIHKFLAFQLALQFFRQGNIDVGSDLVLEIVRVLDHNVEITDLSDLSFTKDYVFDFCDGSRTGW